LHKRSRLSVTLLLAVFLLSSLLVSFVNVHAVVLASPVFDAKSTATPCIVAPLGCSTLKWSHTVGAGPDEILVVSVEVGVAPGHTLHMVSGITYGASALSFIGSHTAFSNLDELEMWYLLKPAAGTFDITVTVAAVDALSGGAVSYSNVGGIVDFEGDTGTSSSSPSTTVKQSVSGNLVVDAFYGSVSDTAPTPTKMVDVTPGAGQTERWLLTGFINHGDGTGEDIFMGGSDKPAMSPVTTTWTGTINNVVVPFDYWLLDAIALGAPLPPAIPEYPLGLSLLAIFMILAYGLIRRRTATKKLA